MDALTGADAGGKFGIGPVPDLVGKSAGAVNENSGFDRKLFPVQLVFGIYCRQFSGGIFFKTRHTHIIRHRHALLVGRLHDGQAVAGVVVLAVVVKHRAVQLVFVERRHPGHDFFLGKPLAFGQRIVVGKPVVHF